MGYGVMHHVEAVKNGVLYKNESEEEEAEETWEVRWEDR